MQMHKRQFMISSITSVCTEEHCHFLPVVSVPKEAEITPELRLVIICGNAWNISLKLSETCTLRSVSMDHRRVLGLALPGDSSSAAIMNDSSIKHVPWYLSSRKEGPFSVFDGRNQEAFLSKVDIPSENIHAIKEGLSVKDAATEYAGQILHLSESVIPKTSTSPNLPVFDLILLGIGPDGHVASLFPNRDHTTGASEGIVLPVDNSPKPPPERISFSMPVINAAKQVVIVAFGGGKAEIVQRALEVQALPGALPAQLVKPASGSLTWYLDADSAQNLHIQNWEDKKAFPRSS